MFRMFNEEMIQYIRDNDEGKSTRQLAKMFGCSHVHIINIRKNRVYKDLLENYTTNKLTTDFINSATLLIADDINKSFKNTHNDDLNVFAEASLKRIDNYVKIFETLQEVIKSNLKG